MNRNILASVILKIVFLNVVSILGAIVFVATPTFVIGAIPRNGFQGNILPPISSAFHGGSVLANSWVEVLKMSSNPNLNLIVLIILLILICLMSYSIYNSFVQLKVGYQKSEKKFNSVIGSVKDHAIIVLDKRGLITEWKEGTQKIYGYQETEILGRHYTYLLNRKDLPSNSKDLALERALQNGIYQEECEHAREDSQRVIVNSAIIPVFNEQGVHRGYINMIVDVTEKKRLEASNHEAQCASLRKTAFLACMSHEIRAPLSSIIGMTELLKVKNLDPEDRKLVSMAHASGETLLSIINGVLDLSRIEAGEMILERVPFSLSEQIKISISMVALRAKEKNINLVSNIEEKLPDSFEGDPIRLRQILINLLTNAIKFSDQGTVSVDVRKAERDPENSDYDQLIFSVSDQGIGIPPSQKETIFGSFKQADQSIYRKFGGTGLGLSIAKKFVELMKGKIWVESIVGQGSTFIFTIGLKKYNSPVLGKLEEGIQLFERDSSLVPESIESEHRPLKILMADDSEENRLIFKAFLREKPYEIVVVEDGQTAVDLFKKEIFDMVFIDVRMPILGGYEATRKMREWEFMNLKKHCPIIAFTASGLPEDFQRSKAAGCDDHLVKPLRKAELLDVVAKYSKPKAYEQDPR